MTPLDLMQSLKEYCKEKTGDMLLVARDQGSEAEPKERPPKVFIGNLPTKEAEKKEAPYILLKLLTTKTDEEENIARVRIIIVTYSEDKEENYIQCLNVITRITTALSQDIVIDNRYSCQKPIETIVYDDDLEVYQIAEAMTIWELPQVQRDVRKYLD